VNLDIAKRLRSLLRADGLEVIMTRSSDTFASLSRRVNIANNSKADLFVSIHSNANRVRSLNGFEVYYISPNVSDSKRALYSAQHEVLDLKSASFASTPSLNLKAILWDMIYTSGRAEALRLSKYICQAIDNSVNTRVLGVKGAPFYVLKGIHMPGVLVEVGYLSNYNEERLLKNNYYRQQIAEGIAEGLHNYKRDSTYTEIVKR
jgi:N-acetylmuramoyl-L-alanine amidase